MKKSIIALLLGTILLLSFGVWFFTCTLWAPVPMIEKNIQRNIPLGTNLEDVLTYINKEKYNLVGHNEHVGLLHYQDGSVGWWPLNDPLGSMETGTQAEQIGVKSIQASLGVYGVVLETEVIVFMAFDENDRLIFLAVDKISAL